MLGRLAGLVWRKMPSHSPPLAALQRHVLTCGHILANLAKIRPVLFKNLMYCNVQRTVSISKIRERTLFKLIFRHPFCALYIALDHMHLISLLVVFPSFSSAPLFSSYSSFSLCIHPFSSVADPGFFPGTHLLDPGSGSRFPDPT
jgi:hypothetical protein